jgi:hypothetical protein
MLAIKYVLLTGAPSRKEATVKGAEAACSPSPMPHA